MTVWAAGSLGGIMIWARGICNSGPYRWLQTGLYFKNMHDAIDEHKAVVPSNRVAGTIAELVRRMVFRR